MVKSNHIKGINANYDPENGILETSGNFRSENKLGMKVKSSYKIQYSYNGKNYKLIDIVVD